MALAVFIIGFGIFVGQAIIGVFLLTPLLILLFPTTPSNNIGTASGIALNLFGLFMVTVGIALFFLYRKERLGKRLS